jgi:C1A family cysteine protease
MYGVTDSGCNGGHPLVALTYSANTGDTYDSCYSYQEANVPYPYPSVTCQQNCDNGTAKPRVKNAAPRRITDLTQVMQEIYTNGPVTVSFQVATDLFTQTVNDSVYVSSGAASRGGHAVTCIGWGVSASGIPYWQILNTWGTYKTYFKIRRGYNDLQVESYMIAADPTGGTVIATGSFTFENTWITGQTVIIGY